jgi:hypothetical protein
MGFSKQQTLHWGAPPYTVVIPTVSERLEDRNVFQRCPSWLKHVEMTLERFELHTVYLH